MAPLLAAIDEGEIVIVALPILSILAVLMTAILTHHYRKLQRDDMEATLKMEMIQRGMSAEEIERVLAARIGSPPNHGRHDARAYAPGPGAVQREA
jgi:hypothetical protein